jgi:DNA-binding SARP family transcriptional activator/nucleoid-associated protein YgaU
MSSTASSTAASSTATSSTAASSTAGADAPFELLDPAVAAAATDLAHSRDPHLLIPGDPVGLRAAARSLVDNADLHDALAVRQRHLHDAGWSGAAADAFHAHLTRQATRHDGAATATRTAATALTELADGIDTARTHAGRAARLDAEGDPDNRTDPALREEAHDLLADTRARLADLHTRVRTRLATAQQALPDTYRLLTDPDPSSRIASPATLILPALADPPALPALDTPATPSTAGAVAVANAAAAPAIPPATAMPLWAAAGTEIPTNGPRQREGPPGAATAGTLATTHRPRRQIVVRPGDTLSGIAARELGDPTRWPEILDCNPALAHPWQIRPGQRLLLPDGPDPATDDPRRSVPDQPDSAQPPPTATPTTHPGGAASPSQPAPAPGLDTTPNDGNSDAGGVSLEEGLLIGGGLAAALSVAYLLHQRRRDRGFRPGASATSNIDDANDNTDLDHDGDRLYRSGRVDRAASFGHGAVAGPAGGRSEGNPDGSDVAASIRAALDPPAPSSRRTAIADEPPTVPARRVGEPAMPPVVRRLHYAYHRTPQTGRPVRPAASGVAGWAGPPLAPQPLHTTGHAHSVQAGSAPLVVPLGISATGAGVYADLTLAPALALTNRTGPDPLQHSGDRAEDAARALLLTIAAGLRTPTGDPLGHVVITTADLRRLLGLTDPLPHTVTLPGTIRVVDDLDAALDDLEVTLAQRPPRPGPHSQPPPAAVLIATAPRPGTPTARMRRLLDAGHPQRVCAILLGDWPTPTRITLAPDATAAAITRPLPPQLAGARLFTVPRHDALDLLAALARPTDPDYTLTPTPTHDPNYRDASAERLDPQHPGVNVDVGADVGASGGRPESDDDPDTAPTPRATQELVPTTTASRGPRWLLQVLGRMSLHAESEQRDPAETGGGTVSGGAGPEPVTGRELELLVYLALHPSGVSHERLLGDLWPDIAPTAAAADLDTMHTDIDAALTPPARELSDPVSPIICVGDHGHRHINPRLMAVDYHHFTAALDARRAAITAAQRATADRALLDHYRGPLAPDLHADWIDAPRRHATRAAITAALDLARYLEDGEDPDQAVAVLQHGIAAIDPYNEALYARLIRLHRDHGRPDAALRTFAALVTQLATIEATPSPDIITLIGIS